MDRTLGNERASLSDGQECDFGPYYLRSSSLQSLHVIPSPIRISILVRKIRVKQGTLRYRRNDENKCVDVSRDYGNYFNATCLEKVNTELRGEERYPVEDEFYPALHRLLTARRNWGVTFQFRGRSTFMTGVMEWTKRMLVRFEEPLKQAGIFGAVGVSQFPYHFDANVWRAFCELWGPLTNTLHHGAGEVGISLYDLGRIGGLTILGAMYEEFLPPNKDLIGHDKYPATVIELLRIHAELCEFHKVKHIYYDLWLDHFYREYLVYFAYGEQANSEKEKSETKKKSPVRISRQERMAQLNVTAEGELAAFLSFWLSRFVFPHGKEVVRPETFIMAALMASGRQISLAPSVLGYIYHGLGEAASHPENPGKANVIFPCHYVIGWLAELFPCLYRRRPDNDCPDDYPTLVHYAGLLGSKLSLPQARYIFRDGRYLSLRASSYREDSRNGRDIIDMGLPDEDRKFLLSIRSSVLPVRVGAELILEPYYPNRFARQFGFDQGVPSNRLSFNRALRQRRTIMDLAQAYADLQRSDTGAKFYIPPSYYEGVCSWDYCSWWSRTTTPYLSQSVEKVHQTTTNKKELLREAVYIIDHLRPLCEFVPGVIEISKDMSDNSAKETSSVPSSRKGKAKVFGDNIRPLKKGSKRPSTDESATTGTSCDKPPVEVNFKRARYDRPDHSDDSDMGDCARFEDLSVADLDAFTEHETLNQQDAPIEKLEEPLHHGSFAVISCPAPVVTAIIPVQEASDALIEAEPIQSIPTSLASLFYNLKEDWVRESILRGVEAIIGLISSPGSIRDLLANRARVSQSLEALRSMINVYKLSTIEIFWLSSKIEEIFDIVESVAHLEELIDIDRVNILSAQDLSCSSEIVHIEDQLNGLSCEASKLKLKEQEILKEEERIRKMREDLIIRQQSLFEAEGKLKSSLDLKRKKAEQVKANLTKAGFSKLQDLQKEKERLNILIGSVISFNNI